MGSHNKAHPALRQIGKEGRKNSWFSHVFKTDKHRKQYDACTIMINLTQIIGLCGK